MIISEYKTGEKAMEIRVSYGEDTKVEIPFPADSEPLNCNKITTSDIAKVYSGVASPKRLNIKLLSIETNDKNSVDAVDLKDAERIYIEKVLTDIKPEEYEDTKNKEMGQSMLHCFINRSANQIALRTRRGAGNIVLHNSANDVSENFNLNIQSVVNDLVPKDTFIVLYRGDKAFDSSVFFIEDSKKLYWLENSPECLGNWEDYVQIFKLV